jgi:hypothetical protein
MTYVMKPLSCDPNRIRGMSERMIISHHENNYGGAVKRLNLIGEKLAELDYASAPGFLVNGFKREQLIATNSMILHEVFFDGLGDESEPDVGLKEALARDFGSFDHWRAEFIAMGKALGGGSGLGAADLVAAGPKVHQPMGVRSLPHHGWRHANSGSRYVRAFLPHRLRRQGCELRRRLHGGDQLARGATQLSAAVETRPTRAGLLGQEVQSRRIRCRLGSQ